MTDPVLLLDSTVLVAYERDLTRRAPALVLEALTDGRLMVTARSSRTWPPPQAELLFLVSDASETAE